MPQPVEVTQAPSSLLPIEVDNLEPLDDVSDSFRKRLRQVYNTSKLAEKVELVDKFHDKIWKVFFLPFPTFGLGSLMIGSKILKEFLRSKSRKSYESTTYNLDINKYYIFDYLSDYTNTILGRYSGYPSVKEAHRDILHKGYQSIRKGRLIIIHGFTLAQMYPTRYRDSKGNKLRQENFSNKVQFSESWKRRLHKANLKHGLTEKLDTAHNALSKLALAPGSGELSAGLAAPIAGVSLATAASAAVPIAYGVGASGLLKNKVKDAFKGIRQNKYDKGIVYLDPSKYYIFDYVSDWSSNILGSDKGYETRELAKESIHNDVLESKRKGKIRVLKGSTMINKYPKKYKIKR